MDVKEGIKEACRKPKPNDNNNQKRETDRKGRMRNLITEAEIPKEETNYSGSLRRPRPRSGVSLKETRNVDTSPNWMRSYSTKLQNRPTKSRMHTTPNLKTCTSPSTNQKTRLFQPFQNGYQYLHTTHLSHGWAKVTERRVH